MNRILCVIVLCLMWLPQRAAANGCAIAGADGSAVPAGIVNTYYPGTNNPSAGATSFALGSARGTTPIAPGDLVLIVQMQDASINRSNTSRYGDGALGDPGSGSTDLRRTGRYEFARATNAVPLSGGTLVIDQPVATDFSTQAANGSRGQRRYQVVRVPQFVNATISGSVAGAAWDGASGGVIALDVAATLTFAGGRIDATGIGFRGAGGRDSRNGSGNSTDYRVTSANGAGGGKGEGIAGTPRLVWNGSSVITNAVEGYPNGSFARGAPGNAGGGGTDGNPVINDQNTGGGGGAGFGDGGRGGHAWCPGGPSVCSQSGGFGGTGLTAQGADRLIMGGGGGAGTTNNATGTPGNGVASGGERGGGIVIVRAATVTGVGSVVADGNDANQTVDNDGSGGGGAGGAIAVLVGDAVATNLSLLARGGRGGSNGNSTPHGPGGGGGGGFVARSSVLTGGLVDVSGGQPGVTEGNPAPFNSNYGATSGSNGGTATVTPADPDGTLPGATCVVAVAKAITPAVTSVGTATRLELTITNPNPLFAATSLSLADSYPADLVNAASPNVSNTCGGSIAAPSGAPSLVLSGATLAAGNTCTIGVDVVPTAAGLQTNTVAAGDASAAIDGNAISNLLPATATVTATEPLLVTKTVSIVSDPFNGASAPYAIPGAVAEYTIDVLNPGPGVIDTDGIRITDLIPDDVAFLNVPIAGGLPVVLDDGSPASGLVLAPDDLAYSDDDGATYSYTPASGADADVDGLQVIPSGSLPSGARFSVRFRVAVQ
ncbi:MAG: hypothetical protein AAFO81_13450 [Pseudomonadota bacterium]